MPFEHRTYDLADQRLHELKDLRSGFRLQVTNLGAELISIARRLQNGHWQGYLYRDGDLTVPPSGWKNHATVMGYFLHRLKGERSSYAGQTIRGGNHSFLRNKHFDNPEVIISERAALSYVLPATRIEPEEYPRRVSFRLNYTLAEESVEVTFVFQNEEIDRPAHVSFGLHPGFAVSSVENARVVLPAGRYRRHLAPENFLSGEIQEFETEGGTMAIRPFELPGSFLIEPVEIDETIVRLHDFGTGSEVQIDLSEAPYFTIWSDLNPFICIEPCWGLPDHQEQRPFEQKLGIQMIPPGGTLTRRFSMRFL
jgi:galactose mutarotase-like enzyme